MKEIYFSNQDNGFNLKKFFLHYSSYSLARFTPKISNLLAEKILCTPIKSKVKKNVLDDFTKKRFSLMGNDLVVYEKGDSNKVVIFSHGWSGKGSDFSLYFDDIINLGFKVVVLDHVAHGDSKEKHSNFYFFYEGVKLILDEYKKDHQISSVIAHSMGAGATVAAIEDKDIKLFLLAPAISVFDFLYTSVTKFGLSARMVKTFLNSYEKKFSISVDNLDPKNKIKNIKNDMHIYHCFDDKFVKLDENLYFLNDVQKENLTSFNGLGHFRILKSKEVRDHILKKL